jgi:hypothetical protein
MSLCRAFRRDHSFLTRMLQTTGLFLALMTASAAGVHAETVVVQGTDGANGDDADIPGDNGQPGGSGGFAAANAGSTHPTTSPLNGATAIGGNGGAGGSATADGSAGPGGGGGDATATAATAIESSSAEAGAASTGGNGGTSGSSQGGRFDGDGGEGGSATALATGSSGRGNVTVSASATGGSGGSALSALGGPGAGGDASASSTATSRGFGDTSSTANATGGSTGEVGPPVFTDFASPGNAMAVANSSAAGGGTATANAVATAGSSNFFESVGAANATSNAETVKGALAQAQSTASGTGAQAQSTAKTSLAGMSVQSTAIAPSTAGGEFVESETTDAIAQGGSGQASVNPGETDAFSTIFPNKAYAATLIDSASNVADALLGPRDKVFGTAILGTQGFGDSAESTFDFRFRGDLLLGLIDGSGQFSIEANGVDILSESFIDDSVINLGNLGPNIDLTLSVNGSGVFAAGVGTVPELSTWAMTLAGFVGLGLAGYSRAKPGNATLARRCG